MIRYAISRKKLLELIDAHDPKWLADARKLTAKCRKAGKFTGKSLWTRVKPVFVRLQHAKCVYCERPMANSEVAMIEYDVEHFRPKKNVKAWPTEAILKKRKITYAAKLDCNPRKGYHLLAHEPANYAASCKVCNSPLKSDFFPIAGKPGGAVTDVAKLNQRELPCLVYPIGDTDDDPKAILTFNGLVPVPAAKTGRAALRAAVCIDFFRLDTRTDLLVDRARTLRELWFQLEAERTGGPAQRKRAKKMIDGLCSDRFPQAACARAFRKLYARDRKAAGKHFEAAEEFVLGKEPGIGG